MAESCAIILAAGASRRMGANKMQLRIGGKTVLERTLAAFEQSGCFSRFILVCRDEDSAQIQALAQNILSVPYTIVAGGSERQYSVWNALHAAKGSDIVAVHDGARCFVSKQVIRDCVEKARDTGAAAAGVRTRDTIKTVDGDQITGTIDRDRLVNIQTPQVFSYDLLWRAHQKAQADHFLGTDECMLVERLGETISFVEAGSHNIKITTQEDILLGRLIAGEKLRIGQGYDAHRLVEERPLILGGVQIPHTHGLLGHSDADVLLHAIIDALLGAAAAGDIGTHFPCNKQYKDASSLDLLGRTKDIILQCGFDIVNIDATVVMERPKLSPYIPNMRGNIAAALGIDIDAVSVKATTTEGMGFEGSCEGVSATAVAMLNG